MLETTSEGKFKSCIISGWRCSHAHRSPPIHNLPNRYPWELLLWVDVRVNERGLDIYSHWWDPVCVLNGQGIHSHCHIWTRGSLSGRYFHWKPPLSWSTELPACLLSHCITYSATQRTRPCDTKFNTSTQNIEIECSLTAPRRGWRISATLWYWQL
jgi:hypothetical protein